MLKFGNTDKTFHNTMNVKPISEYTIVIVENSQENLIMEALKNIL